MGKRHVLEALDDHGPEHPEGHKRAAHGGHPHPGLLEALLLVIGKGVVRVVRGLG